MKKALGSFIAVLRKSRGMTQKELPEKKGYCYRLYNNQFAGIET